MGAGLEVTCPSCSHRNSLGSNFCSSCGVRLGDERDDRTDAIALDELVDSGSAADRDNLADDADDADDAADADDGFDRSDFAPDMGVLFVSRGAKAGSRYALDEPVVTAGRHPDSTIFLDDVTVSRRHAELASEEGVYLVRDVGSLNGTYVNRERIDEAVLHDGDELQVGKFKLFFFHGTGGR